VLSDGTATQLPSYAGDVTKGVLLWGAQLEQRSAVTAYTATTTQAITNYIPVLQTAASGVARFDNNPTTGESLGLLIEESRTNLVTYSSDLTNAAWTKAGGTITANTIVAPDGTLSGDKLVEDSANSTHQVNQAYSITSGTVYTCTIYAKAAERSFIAIQPSSDSRFAYFNLTTGTVGSTGGSPTATSIQSVGNGWYRCSITFSAITTGSVTAIVYCANADSGATYTGNGFSGVFLWGAQLEAGSFATSYIPTVASQVTRAADAASMTGTNFSTWYRADEGTIYSESNTAAFSTSSNDRCVAEVNDTSSSNFLRIQRRATSQTSSARCTASNSDVMQLNSLGSWTTADYKKVIVVYKFNDAAASADAGTVSTDTSFSLPVVTKLEIGSARSGDYLCGTIKKIAYYPLRVTNAQLQSLTS
jgi:hypothetical protein